jgi:Tfp pilus assembly protein PilO
MIMVVLLVMLINQRQTLLELTQRRAELSQAAHRFTAPAQAQDLSDARSRLRQFEGYLTKHEDIPVVVEDVLRRAEDEGLSIQRGDYRPQIDGPGGFLRYRMNLPVTGKPDAIHRFIQAALAAHRSLALESIHFGRERMESGQIEARLQWTLFTGLPAGQHSDVPGAKEMQ